MANKHRIQVQNAIIEVIEPDNENEATYLNIRFDNLSEAQLILYPRHAKALAALIQGDP